jgi:hypothetical protein
VYYLHIDLLLMKSIRPWAYSSALPKIDGSSKSHKSRAAGGVIDYTLITSTTAVNGKYLQTPEHVWREMRARSRSLSLSLCSANARVISAADAPSECALIRLQSHIKRDTRYGFSSIVPVCCCAVCESGPHASSHC